MAKLDCSKVVDFRKVDAMICNGKFKCESCPLDKSNNGTQKSCTDLKRENIEKYIELLQGWIDTHAKTYAEDFFEKFPNAVRIKVESIPEITWCTVHNHGSCNKKKYVACTDCWNDYMEVQK